MSEEPENLVLRLLREMRSDMKDMRAELKADIADVRAELKSEIRSLRADVASDLIAVNARIDSTRKEIGEQIVGLRRAVVEYHSSVVGHGVLISELEARMNRVENKLGLPPLESH